MAERKTPPLAASSTPYAVDRTMPDNRHGANATPMADMPWPPPGWPMFSCVTSTSGHAAYPVQPRTGESAYLAYQVGADEDGIYTVEIHAGTHTPQGANLSTVIGMRFSAARDEWFDEKSSPSVIDMHVHGQRLLPERAAILRVVLAMTFIISRIDRGNAPNLRRVMKMYRLG